MDSVRQCWKTIVVDRIACLLHEKKSGIPPRADFVTLICFCLMVLLGATRQVWLTTPGVSASTIGTVANSNLNALENDPPPASHVRGIAARCVWDVSPVIRSSDCDEAERERWVWGAPNAVRKAMGESLCWWHASVADLADIPGITESYAMLAIKMREQVDGVREPSELEVYLGKHRTKVLDEALTTGCAMIVRPGAR